MERKNKDVRIEVRMTPEEKERLKDFAASHNLTISETVRMALQGFMNK